MKPITHDVATTLTCHRVARNCAGALCMAWRPHDEKETREIKPPEDLLAQLRPLVSEHTDAARIVGDDNDEACEVIVDQIARLIRSWVDSEWAILQADGWSLHSSDPLVGEVDDNVARMLDCARFESGSDDVFGELVIITERQVTGVNATGTCGLL